MEMSSRQALQYEHDMRNHFDILALSRADRLKHYGLHFAKYAGRLARGDEEEKSRAETLVDAFLVALSAANALNQKLPNSKSENFTGQQCSDLAFTSYAGRFADACEKIDHLEDFRETALIANEAIVAWILINADRESLNLDQLVEERRQQLAARSVYAVST